MISHRFLSNPGARSLVDWRFPSSLRNAKGVPLSGTVSNQNTLVVFDPDEPLQPAPSYRATLDWCAGAAATEFQTSELGLPLTVDLADRTFEFDLLSYRNDSIHPYQASKIILHRPFAEKCW